MLMYGGNHHNIVIIIQLKIKLNLKKIWFYCGLYITFLCLRCNSISQFYTENLWHKCNTCLLALASQWVSICFNNLILSYIWTTIWLKRPQNDTTCQLALSVHRSSNNNSSNNDNTLQPIKLLRWVSNSWIRTKCERI